MYYDYESDSDSYDGGDEDSVYGRGYRHKYLSKKGNRCVKPTKKNNAKYWQEYNGDKRSRCISYATHVKNKGSKSNKISTHVTSRGAPLFPSGKKGILVSKSGAEYVLNKHNKWVSKKKMILGKKIAKNNFGY